MARNPKEEECRRFAELYMFDAGFNATKAARMLCEETGKELRSYREFGSQLLNNEKTDKALQELREANSKSFEISKDEIVAFLKEIARDEGESTKSRLDATDKLIRMIGGYNDSLEMKGTQTLEVVIE